MDKDEALRTLYSAVTQYRDVLKGDIEQPDKGLTLTLLNIMLDTCDPDKVTD